MHSADYQLMIFLSRRGDVPENHSAEPVLEPSAFAAVAAGAFAEASNQVASR